MGESTEECCGKIEDKIKIFNMNKIAVFTLRVFRKIFHERKHEHMKNPMEGHVDFRRCQFLDQDGNDYIYHRLLEYKGGGLMLAKWGTVELRAVISYLFREHKPSFGDYINCIKGRYDIWGKGNGELFSNAGVFPNTLNTRDRFAQQALKDCRDIDILASYQKAEIAVAQFMPHATCVNLDAFYAPFLWDEPWTQWLKGKRVLVIHPFVESIKQQYDSKRELLFENPKVLPEFKELICIKAVQSLGGGKDLPFQDWFEALEAMKRDIDQYDFDVAIIGCGAYGMSLAAYIKQKGKVAIHLAGWTQMLFGVYGKRWVEHQVKYSRFINEHWVRPYPEEKPQTAKNVEDGCYW